METIDYSIFKKLPGNREVSIESGLIDSMKSNGYLKQYPILVDSEMRIIYGQHRLIAAKELNLPVSYESVELTLAEAMEFAIKVNGAGKGSWKLKDYIHMNACLGKGCYKVIEEIEELYAFGTSQTISIVTGWDTATKMIKTGEEFAINPNKDKIVSFILLAKEILPFWRSAIFVRSVCHLYRQATEEQILKITSNMISIKQQVDIPNYMTVFENIINKRSGRGIKVSFN